MKHHVTRRLGGEIQLPGRWAGIDRVKSAILASWRTGVRGDAAIDLSRRDRSVILNAVPNATPQFPEIDFSDIGPSVGERLADVVLPNQRGELVDLHAARANRRAVVLFHRSADW